MRKGSYEALGLLVSLVVLGCAPGAPPAREQRAAGEPATAQRRTLVIVARGEPPSLAAKPLQTAGGALDTIVPLYNATLDFVDDRGVAQPYLVEALPQLHTDSWRVFPDGTMETSYRLRLNLTWHDGSALSAEDFAFAWRVYATPALGVSASLPIGAMAEVLAPDSRTVVIRWGKIHPEAGALEQRFQALPRHILEEPFQKLDSEAFANHPFWSHEYVGLGPYRLERWEPGAFIEGFAFEGHALGRPKIERTRVVIIPDTTTAVAAMLSGEAHFSAEYVLWYEEGVVLQREWGPRRGGKVLFSPTLPRISQIQLRPGFANPRELLDVRVRRGLAHAIDGPTLVEVLTGGHGLLTPSITHPQADYHPLVDRAVAKHPYDLRRAQQLLEEAGLTRGGDGLYLTADGGPFKLEVWHIVGATNERENAIIVEGLRRIGVNASSHAYPSALLRDTERRAKLPALFTGGGPGGEASLLEYSSSTIPRPENRWQGNNRGGWSNPEFDRFGEAFHSTLDRAQRVQHIVQMERILSDDVGTIPHYYSPTLTTHVASLHGPTARQTPEAGRGIRQVHTWEWRASP